MTTREEKTKNMQKYRARWKEEKFLAQNRCPRCKMMLNPEYEKYHKGCPYYEEKLKNHQKIANEPNKE